MSSLQPVKWTPWLDAVEGLKIQYLQIVDYVKGKETDQISELVTV